jgi:large subunit ribosomal protein L23
MRSPHEVIIQPLVTEKGTWMMEEFNQYIFRVAPDANKVEIEKAVEQLWPVTVVDVRTQNMRGKVVRRGRFVGRRANWKKAIVTLNEEDSIELFEGV